MRRFGDEGSTIDARVEAANAKVVAILAHISTMAPDDPELPATRKLLTQMRHGASSALLAQALHQHDSECD